MKTKRNLSGIAAALLRKNTVETGKQITMPGLRAMNKRQMAEVIQSVWTLCDEELVPTHNTSAGLEWHEKKADGMSLYGRVYCALVRRPDWLSATFEIKDESKEPATKYPPQK